MAPDRGPRDPGAEPLNFKHRYRWNHAILAANQQNLLEKLK